MVSTLVLMEAMVLDISAFVLALFAEQWRSSAKIIMDEELNNFYCLYDSSISTVLGIAAFSLLSRSQKLTMKPTLWWCCKPKTTSSPNRSSACAIVLPIISWLTFFTAEACLLLGSMINVNHKEYRTIFGQHLHCQTLRKGVFEAGAAFIVLTSLASNFYHVCYTEQNEDLQTINNGNASVRHYYLITHLVKLCLFEASLFFYVKMSIMMTWLISLKGQQTHAHRSSLLDDGAASSSMGSTTHDLSPVD
ncbi:uncharacterized protein LOC119987744 [Tripterygium wilfordii]|uniref:uncharacterized protein LOC119987744 n=1 Tax=Tripterygium wilfordii TaxID=458696 RepID=UPI0018F7F26D|nr:uncharacterized protein LOC119987744 [Tripterygium wilfordii]